MRCAKRYDYLAEGPGTDLRGALEDLIDVVTISPAQSSRGKVEARAAITWRDGVEQVA